MTLNEIFKILHMMGRCFRKNLRHMQNLKFHKNSSWKRSALYYVRNPEKEIKLTPEEAVRQLYIYKLMHDYGYAASRIQLETPIHFGREIKRADIAIMDKDRPMVPYIIVELKNQS